MLSDISCRYVCVCVCPPHDKCFSAICLWQVRMRQRKLYGQAHRVCTGHAIYTQRCVPRTLGRGAIVSWFAKGLSRLTHSSIEFDFCAIQTTNPPFSSMFLPMIPRTSSAGLTRYRATKRLRLETHTHNLSVMKLNGQCLQAQQSRDMRARSICVHLRRTVRVPFEQGRKDALLGFPLYYQSERPLEARQPLKHHNRNKLRTKNDWH